METLLNIKFDHFRNKHFVRFLGLHKYGTKWFESWILSYILHDIKRRLTFEKILDLLNEFIIEQKNLWKMTVTKGAQCTLNGDLWDNFLQCIFSNYFLKNPTWFVCLIVCSPFYYNFETRLVNIFHLVVLLVKAKIKLKPKYTPYCW